MQAPPFSHSPSTAQSCPETCDTLFGSQAPPFTDGLRAEHWLWTDPKSVSIVPQQLWPLGQSQACEQ